MSIALASDHAAFELKEQVKKWLSEHNLEFRDFGTHSIDSCDYPDFCIPAAESVAKKGCDRGVIMCGSGIGMSITANKIPGVYAALCTTGIQAQFSRLHNDSNVLILAARLTGWLEIEDILERWFNTEFEAGRHAIRVGKIKEYEKKLN